MTQYIVKEKTATNKLVLEEVQGCDSIQYGGVFVSRVSDPSSQYDQLIIDYPEIL
jgi:hypothetical protein